MRRVKFLNTIPKAFILGLCFISVTVQLSNAQSNDTNDEQKIIKLSKDKWRWMSEKKADTLAALFHDKAMFVHMGGSWGKEQEINVIKSGGIWYKQADIQEVSVKFIGNTAILLNKIRLTAVVGGSEVVNPFMVTEVYVLQDGTWKMGSLSFSRLSGS